MLFELAEAGEATVQDLAERLSTSRPAVSQHLSVMAGAGLLSKRRVAGTVYYQSEDPTSGKLLRAAVDHLTAYGSASRQGLALEADNEAGR